VQAGDHRERRSTLISAEKNSQRDFARCLIQRSESVSPDSVPGPVTGIVQGTTEKLAYRSIVGGAGTSVSGPLGGWCLAGSGWSCRVAYVSVGVGGVHGWNIKGMSRTVGS
jgi:hypothetical protein